MLLLTRSTCLAFCVLVVVVAFQRVHGAVLGQTCVSDGECARDDPNSFCRIESRQCGQGVCECKQSPVKYIPDAFDRRCIKGNKKHF